MDFDRISRPANLSAWKWFSHIALVAVAGAAFGLFAAQTTQARGSDSDRFAQVSAMEWSSQALPIQPVTPPAAPPAQPTLPNTAGPELTANQRREILARIEDVFARSAYGGGADFNRWPEFLAKHQEAIDQATTHRDFANAVNRAFREFRISHIRLLTPRAAELRRTAPRQEPVDLGRRPRSTESLEAFFQTTPVEPIATPVTPPAAPAPNPFTTGERTARPETLTWPEPNVAVLRVWTFSAGYGRTNIERLMEQAAPADLLILDLRGNGGGLTTNMQHLLSLMMPPDTIIGTFVSRRLAQQYRESQRQAEDDVVAIARWTDRHFRTRRLNQKPFEGAIVVLINRGSGSASEITAQALREQRGARIVGTRSAGAVLASVYTRLPHGFELQYPVTDYVSAKGVRLEGNPVEPDVVVAAVRTPDSDPVLERAIEFWRAEKDGGPR